MSDTKEKLREAEFFLNQMEYSKSNPDTFRYYLSAFLSAARSITLVMQTEFGKYPNFKNWYEQINIKNDKELAFLNEKRRITIHLNRLNVEAHTNTIIIPAPLYLHLTTYAPSIEITGEELNKTAVKLSQVIPQKETDKSDLINGSVIIEFRWYFDDLPDKEILSWSKEQLEKLGVLVAQWETKLIDVLNE